MSKRIGILTGGGDAPGLNAVIRAVVKAGTSRHDWQLFGIEESFNGLIFDEKEIWLFNRKIVGASCTRRHHARHDQSWRTILPQS